MVPSRGRKRATPQDRCRFELILASAPHEIQKVEKFLSKANASIGLDDGTMYRILVAATEAANNAILHGNQSDPSKEVKICIQATKRLLTIRVDDEGPGFDPSKLPNPLEEANLLKEHGRGVFLIRSLMDDVKFVQLAKGSAIIMKVRLDRLR